MQIVTQDKVREFEFTKEEGGGKLFYRKLSKLEYLRIMGSSKNIKLREEIVVDIDTNGMAEKEIKEHEKQQDYRFFSQFIINNAVTLICETNVIENWDGFVDENKKELTFSQEYLQMCVVNYGIDTLMRIVMTITDDLYVSKKKEIPKKKKPTKKSSAT